MQQKFYSNGKLLLSGEYAILDGAKGLAVPTKFGQSLEITPIEEKVVLWKSLTSSGAIWFSAAFNPLDLSIKETSDTEISHTLQQILIKAKKLNPKFIATGSSVITNLSFPRKWGLGTSSTLINNIALWAGVDAHELLWKSFGGSGYDISCAQHNTPILYHIKNNLPQVAPVHFDPVFKEAIFFVYLNQKQSSKKAISKYRSKQFNLNNLISDIDAISSKMVSTQELGEFEALIVKHEKILSKVLETPPVKEKLFPDYFGAVKSLGGWGGDFVMATGNEKTLEYFKSKGFDTVIPFEEMIL
jgi:mevalonate kinase